MTLTESDIILVLGIREAILCLMSHYLVSYGPNKSLTGIWGQNPFWIGYTNNITKILENPDVWKDSTTGLGKCEPKQNARG